MRIKRAAEKTQPPAPKVRKVGRPWWALIWAAVVLTFLLILLPFALQIFTFNTYNPTSVINNGPRDPTPAPTVILGQVQDMAGNMQRQEQQIQNMLNLLNTFAAILGAIFAVFAVIAVALGVYGFSTNNGFRDLEDEWNERLEKIITLQHETEEKGRIIKDLEEEVRQKREEIKQFQDELELLKDQLQDNVTAAQSSLNRQLEEISAVVAHFGTGWREPSQGNIRVMPPLLDEMEDVVAHQSGDPRVNFTLGRMLGNIGKYNEAIEFLEAAIQLDPAYAEAHKELGLAYRRRADRYNGHKEEEREHDYNKALEELHQAVQLNPEDADTFGILGGLHRRLGNYQRAMDYYMQGAQADPDSSYALGNAATLAWRIGQKEQSLRLFERTKEAATKRLETLSSSEPFWDYYDIAMAELILGDVEKAQATYEKAIELTPTKVQFDSMLNNLYFLQDAREQVSGLRTVIQMLEKAKARFH